MISSSFLRTSSAQSRLCFDQKSLSHRDGRAGVHPVGQSKIRARKDNDRRALLEVTHLLASPITCLAANVMRSAIAQIERRRQAMKPHARHQDRGYRDERDTALGIRAGLRIEFQL